MSNSKPLLERVKMTRTQDTAQQYDDLTDAIIDLLDELRGDIGIHNRNFDKDGRNWGYIGDLEHVKSLLRQAHNFLNNIDEE